MSLFDRRAVLGGLAAALAANPVRAAAEPITDATGRPIARPATLGRVFPAGPPAAILLYTLAPDLLLGWPRANRTEEREFLLRFPQLAHEGIDAGVACPRLRRFREEAGGAEIGILREQRGAARRVSGRQVPEVG